MDRTDGDGSEEQLVGVDCHHRYEQELYANGDTGKGNSDQDALHGPGRPFLPDCYAVRTPFDAHIQLRH